jgi:hypothetical protein
VKLKWINTLGLLAIAFLSIGASSANAASIALQLSDSLGNTYTIYDGGAGDSNGTAGVVSWNGGVGLWNINVTVGKGAPYLDLGNLDLSSIDSSSTGDPGVLTIMLTEVDVNTPISLFDMQFGGTNKNTTASYATYFSNNNGYFEQSSLIGLLGPYDTASFSGSLTNLSAPTDDLYSLTQVLTITPTSSSKHTFSGGAHLDPSSAQLGTIPEPSMLLLLGTGLLGLATARNRFRNR